VPAARVSWITCAVLEEAQPIKKLLGNRETVRVLITGIGQKNAENVFRAALVQERPSLVLSCGFAGGLNPALAVGTVLFAADDQPALTEALLSAGARAAVFYCADKIAVTAADKQALWGATGADAVEMESKVIQDICRAERIPAATVRVISDNAGENLPLDFNRLLTAEKKIAYGRLAGMLLQSPGKIAELLKFRRQTQRAAERLAAVLVRL
jgi:adenosylhomocysteine nucleosidase